MGANLTHAVAESLPDERRTGKACFCFQEILGDVMYFILKS